MYLVQNVPIRGRLIAVKSRIGKMSGITHHHHDPRHVFTESNKILGIPTVLRETVETALYMTIYRYSIKCNNISKDNNI